MDIERAYFILYMVVMCWFSLLITVMLIRSVKGPGIADRVMAINMIGTMVISCIAILSVMLNESYLCDVALIYAMISFVSVLILISVYIPKRKLRGMFEEGDVKNADAGISKETGTKPGNRIGKDGAPGKKKR